MLAELTVNKFMSTLASDEPVPGGGSASALAAATSCSLIGMVAALTVGKKGYEDAWNEMEQIRQRMIRLSQEFLASMDEDADSYAKVIKAYQLPKESEEEKVLRGKAIQEAIKLAALIPLEIAEKAATLFADAKRVIEIGNKNAASDGAVGALMARSAVFGALYNVKINLGTLKDLATVEEFKGRATSLDNRVSQLEEQVLQLLQF